MYEALDELNEAFIEAILAADLTEAAWIDWEQRLLEWDDQLRRFMGESTFAADE